MGTRADFYIGRGETAEWIGSIAWDGYPAGIDKLVFEQTTAEAFRGVVQDFIGPREDKSTPESGWPWPWKDSQTTDYAYAFDGGMVHASSFGHAWFDPRQDEPEDQPEEKPTIFPDMKAKQRPDIFGPHSGVIVVFGVKS